MTSLQLATDFDALVEMHETASRAQELRCLVALQQTAEQALYECVSDARTVGASWADVAAALGTTRQAAAKRFAARGPARR